MYTSPIFTSEPMVTRALAAEVRHYGEQLQALLESRSGMESFGTLRRVQCEATPARVDVLLEFERADGQLFLVGLEAKFDHELSREQLLRENDAVQRLFVILQDPDCAPRWLAEEFPTVPVVSWHDVLGCFPASRITMNDLDSIRTPKAAVEARFHRLRLDEQLKGWSIESRRNGSGNPSIVFESPKLPDGRTLRGQIQVAGRGMQRRTEDVRLEGHMGISVIEDDSNFFDPAQSPTVPAWIESLKTLQREVLDGHEERLLISRRAPGNSLRNPGQWKKALASKHLGRDAHLAKGYVDWAIGPKTLPVPLERLDDLAVITVEVFGRWFAAESR
ncbi:hypothetical protein [Microbacterium esteraromaticum]|uniref:hypothetical protein n=1 Tax=Microbacterium esteraromaticum TaxID=57043 RepID=UPI00195C6150|nr:hypothetical protein [Microbacterium esteraromaticum]MBM7466113.1 hypothetical protein [Microbacterium esteraromaticum]